MVELSQPGAVKRLGAHIWKREINEHYVEPEWVSQRLFDEEAFVGSVHDPACGFGRIVHAARRAGLVASGSDLVERSNEFPGGRDFIRCTDIFDNIVTNPPFDIARQFALHALTLVNKKVAIVFPTARLNAARWLDATPLARISDTAAEYAARSRHRSRRKAGRR